MLSQDVYLIAKLMVSPTATLRKARWTRSVSAIGSSAHCGASDAVMKHGYELSLIDTDNYILIIMFRYPFREFSSLRRQLSHAHTRMCGPLLPPHTSLDCGMYRDCLNHTPAQLQSPVNLNIRYTSHRSSSLQLIASAAPAG